MSDRSHYQSAILDDLARLASNAAGLAQGAREEAETLLRSRLDRWLASRDLVSREEFDSVREMAIQALEENRRLAERVAELENRISSTG